MAPEQVEEAEEVSLMWLGYLWGLALLLSLVYLFRKRNLTGNATQPAQAAHKATLPKEQHKKEKDVKATKAAPKKAQARAEEPEEPKKAAPPAPGISLKALAHKAAKAEASKGGGQDAGPSTQTPFYLATLKGHQDAVTGTAFGGEDGSLLATACEDRAVRLFRLPPGLRAAKNIPFRRKDLRSIPVAVAFGKGSVCVSTKGMLNAASLTAFELGKGDGPTIEEALWSVESIHQGLPALSLSSSVGHNQGAFLSASPKTDVRLVSLEGQVLASLDSGGMQNHSVAFTADGRFIAAGTFSPDVRIYEASYDRSGAFQSLRKVMDLKGHNSQVLSVSFSSDGLRAVTSSKDRTLAVWNLGVRYWLNEDPKKLLQVPQSLPEGQCYTQLAFGPTDVIAAAFGGSGNATLHFISAISGKVVERVEQAHKSEILDLRWGPAGGATARVLATASRDRTVRLWEAPF